MTSPPAKCTEHHHDPRLFPQVFWRTFPRHVRSDGGQVVEIHVCAFSNPVAKAVMVPRLAFAKVAPCVSPIVDTVCNMRRDEVKVAKALL